MSAAEVLTEPDAPPPSLKEEKFGALSPSEARRLVVSLPMSTRFALGKELSVLQQAFLEVHGFAVFDRVASPDEVQMILDETDRIADDLVSEGRREVYGVPVWVGKGPEGEPFLQRLAFTSTFSDKIHGFIRDARFEPVRRLIGENARIGDREKDGVVMNRYVRAPGSLRPGLAWHTDGLRDIFYNGRMPERQLNVGLHFDRIRPSDGGLRLIPGSHNQGLRATLFRKAHFVSQAPDRDEVMVETWPGDLTVHDGRMWHRVAASPYTGQRSMRRSMYVPYLTDAYQPKDENSKALGYHRFFDLVMRAKGRLA